MDLVTVSGNGFIFDPFKVEELADMFVKMDSMDESTWNDMSKMSTGTIDKWKVSQFATALCDAVVYAIANKRTDGMRLVHRILTR